MDVGLPASTLAPSLLRRAQSLAAEHDALQSTLSASFDAAKAKRAGELSRVAAALAAWTAARASMAELAAMANAAPDDDVNDPNSSASQEDADLAAIARDELASEAARLEGLERALSESLTPRHPFADLPCMLEFRPGPGGLEGRYFTDSLFRMYKALCARRGYRHSVLKYELADAAGDQSSSAGEQPLQEAVLEVQDAGAYDVFRSEAGMHRVQRIPSTESKGRVHTSAVAVWVLPSFAESNSGGGGGASEVDVDDPESDFYVNPADVRVETMRARGAGGQHVNKTESAIRLTHAPSGTVVSMQDHRSQQRNREDAWKVLRSRVAAQRVERRQEEAARLRSSVLSRAQITRGDKIRTYNYGQDRCSDHRAGLDVHNLPDVLAGGDTLDRVMDAAREWLVARDVEAVAAEEEAKLQEQDYLANARHLGADVASAVVVKLLDDALDDDLTQSRVGLGEELGDGCGALARGGHEGEEARVAVDEHVTQRRKRLEEVGLERERRREQIRVLLARQQVRLGGGEVHDGGGAARAAAACVRVPVSAAGYTAGAVAAEAAGAVIVGRVCGRGGATGLAAARSTEHVGQAGSGEADGGGCCGRGGRGSWGVGVVDLLERIELGEQGVEAAQELEREVVDGRNGEAEEQVVGGLAGKTSWVEAGHAREVGFVEEPGTPPSGLTGLRPCAWLWILAAAARAYSGKAGGAAASVTTALEEAALPSEVVEEPLRRPVGAEDDAAEAAPSEALREPKDGLRGSRASMGTAPAENKPADEGTGGGGDCGGGCKGSMLMLPSRVAGRKGRADEDEEKTAELKRGDVGGGGAPWTWLCGGMAGSACRVVSANKGSSRFPNARVRRQMWDAGCYPRRRFVNGQQTGVRGATLETGRTDSSLVRGAAGLDRSPNGRRLASVRATGKGGGFQASCLCLGLALRRAPAGC
ncbi:peptide chain release factor 1 [Purpureocillium lavendulum]|uniref:Peptide chain release factor 1 n=1 Tax=Purpureocillium lavendulum TaxID=1247861 RepID=A0AB34FEM7_9HYPO|nr:peptide chain release factor 1 [Purpureocillium lavendulum]